MSFLDKFRRKKEDPEVARRATLMKSGRIGEATILDADVDAEGETIFSYCYSVAGVYYETVQRMNGAQLADKERYRLGSQAEMRYDPRHPANSILV